ncbi:MAG: gliding motility-associated C-terminal domain-containing protein, partial [Chitinophagales bacterium]
YSDTLANSLGCDSIVTLDLTLNLSSTSTINESACDSYTSPSGNYTWTNSGNYTDTLANAAGCDSIITIDLTIHNSTATTENISACDDYTWPVNGQSYTTSGIYSDTLISATGCDSVLTLDLTINSSNSISETVTACDSYTWPVDGNTYNASGIYSDTLSNSIGCDSILILDLTINSSNSGSENITACNTYTWTLSGDTYTQSGVYTDTSTNAAGCDSIATLNLTINNNSTGSASFTACDSFTAPSGNFVWTNSGTYTDTINASTGCDSIITINLTINFSNSFSENITECYSYTWPVNGQEYTTSGTYTTTLSNAAGCDSLLILNLNIQEDILTSILETICEGDSIFLNGNWQSAPGNYTDTFSTTSSCDSIVSTTLSLQPNYTDSTEVTLEPGELFNGDIFVSDTTLLFQYYSADGCDSIVLTKIEVLKESVVFVPNAFTPNGDGINDLFKVYGTRIESMRLQIFNRWGEMIFETNEIDKGWDGTYKGEKLPAGLYVYILRGVAANEFVKEVGKVSLLR